MRAIRFLCVANSARSQMAEALAGAAVDPWIRDELRTRIDRLALEEGLRK